MNTEVMFSSERTDWETPQDLFNELNEEFHFTLDVCATEENKKCERYFSKKINGLTEDWFGTCFMNPPYGREIIDWVKKAHDEVDLSKTMRETKSDIDKRVLTTCVVGLLPARTDTQWFHDYIYNKAEIRFLKGRVRFVGAKYSAPFPSMICIWR
jgi:site-specific DNA-methyltransferase (adenine-specific)